jgi:TolB-like protein/class 3 adenylate cyclase/Flp pilus assembly protein TadD
LKRRLAAILAADVVGYSKLMGENQIRTLDALRELRKELFEPAVTNHNGSVIKSMGDGWIVEFASVSDAVNCATLVQTELAGHEIIKLRMGIHTGEVILEDDDLFGDGVNIAARLEALTPPGDILISENALHSLDRNSAAQFTEFGTHQLKNIARPVTMWCWSLSDEAVAVDKATTTDITARKAEKPSIAVLPFDNMSGDAEQEYFSDGIAEDIITDLSKFSWLTVIARNSSFSFKGQSVDLRTVAKELNVRYVLEGSVRKAGNRVRITAQFIDASDGSHIWADRFDRQLDDIFELQDEITLNIVNAIAPELERFETRRALDKRPENLEVWDYILRARHAWKEASKPGFEQCMKFLQLALAQEPENIMALSSLSLTESLGAFYGWAEDNAEALVRANEYARKALSIDGNDAEALLSHGVVELMLGNHAKAISVIHQAIVVNSNNPFCRYFLGTALMWSGEPEAAIDTFQYALRLNPRDKTAAIFAYTTLGFACFLAGRYDEALDWSSQACHEAPDYATGHRVHAACAAHLGQLDEAHQSMEKLLSLEPAMTIKSSIGNLPITDRSVLGPYIEALKAAGMPEE